MILIVAVIFFNFVLLSVMFNFFIGLLLH